MNIENDPIIVGHCYLIKSKFLSTTDNEPSSTILSDMYIQTIGVVSNLLDYTSIITHETQTITDWDHILLTKDE